MRRYFDLVLFIVLAGGALLIMHWQNNRIDAAAASTLAGALLGGAAVLLGNWITRYNDEKRKAQELYQRRARLTALIVSELVDVAAGLIPANELLTAGQEEIERRGGVINLGLDEHLPRDMPYTFGLRGDLLLLDEKSLDALSILRANLAATRRDMVAIGKQASAGLLRWTAVTNGLRHTTGVLADCFDRIAPTRQLELDPGHPEVASSILRRVASGGTARKARR